MRTLPARKRILVFIAALLLVSFSVILDSGKRLPAPGKEGGGATAQATEPESTDSAAEEPVEIGMFINHTSYPLKEWKGAIPEAITKKTGVKLKLTIASDDKQLLLLIASGDLPEMVFAGVDYLKRLSDYNICHSWNKLIRQYAPDFAIDKKTSDLYTMTDGSFYTLLDEFGTQEAWESEKYAMPIGVGLCFRADLLDKLGNPPVTSLEELDKVLEMAREQFQGLTPLTLSTSWKGAYIASQYGLTLNNGFVEDSGGKVVYYLKQQGMLDFYKTMNLFYRKGYIDPQNYVYKDEKEAYSMVVNGKSFAFMDTSATADKLNNMAAKEGTDYRFVQLIQPINDKAAYYNTSIGWSGVFITKNNKHPRESINFMKFLYSEEGQRLSYWGEEGRHWIMSPQGYPEFKVNTVDEDVLVKEGMKWSGLFAGNSLTAGLFNYNPDHLQTAQAAFEVKKRTVYKPELGMLLPDINTSQNTIKTNIEEMITNEEIKAFLAKSEEDCEEAYGSMLLMAEQLGLSELESWANSEYQNVKALFE